MEKFVLLLYFSMAMCDREKKRERKNYRKCERVRFCVCVMEQIEQKDRIQKY